MSVAADFSTCTFHQFIHSYGVVAGETPRSMLMHFALFAETGTDPRKRHSPATPRNTLNPLANPSPANWNE